MSGIRKAENTLFDQWETAFSGGGYFNRDGVVNPGQWESEREFRLLFLMKDNGGCGKSSVFPAAWALEENRPEILRDDESGLHFYHSVLLRCPVAELRHPNRANVEEWCRKLKKFKIPVLGHV